MGGYAHFGLIGLILISTIAGFIIGLIDNLSKQNLLFWDIWHVLHWHCVVRTNASHFYIDGRYTLYLNIVNDILLNI